MLNGNMISWNNNYYQILDKDNSFKKKYIKVLRYKYSKMY